VINGRFRILTGDDLAALAWGSGAEAAVLATLRDGQLGKHKLLLRGIVWAGSQAVPDAAAMLHDNYDRLAAMERREPEKVAAVIGNPHVGAWAARCLRGLSAGRQSARSDIGYLGAVTAATAVRTGHRCTLALQPHDGMVMLPTLGRALLPGHPSASITVSGPMHATIEAGDRSIVISGDPEEDAAGWQGLRWLNFGDRKIPLDDLDPYREYGRCPLAKRLGKVDVDHWRRTLDAAWHLLCVHHPGYAAILRSGITSMVPIVLKSDQKNVSATSGDAFAAVAVSRPSDGAALALALIHEFQHAKLCAAIDLEPLFHRNDKQLFYAPWRPDPRPVSALFQGIYAHMGVADFWRVHRRIATGAARLVAEVEFARWLGQTIDAATRLDGHRGLTEAGQHLLSNIVARLNGWLEEPVPALARELAEMTAADHLICWRLRNLVPDAADVEEIAQAWLTRGSFPRTARVGICPPDDDSGRIARSELLYEKLCDPDQFGAKADDPRHDPDLAYVHGDYSAAARGYLAQIKAAPAAQLAWGGLALTSAPNSPLRRYPEVVAAVYRRLVRVSAPPADPRALAEWLAPLSVSTGTAHV